MSAQEYRRIVAIDFDGTLAITKFPEIIKPNSEGIMRYKLAKQSGAILILWTCRCGDDLTAAVEWCKERGLIFDYINENAPENIEKWGNDSRKIFAHEYIDDKATNPDREAMWARRVRQLYTQRIVSAFGLAIAFTLTIEMVLTLIKIFM